MPSPMRTCVREEVIVIGDSSDDEASEQRSARSRVPRGGAALHDAGTASCSSSADPAATRLLQAAKEVARRLEAQLQKAAVGVVLIAGSTGSGKTLVLDEVRTLRGMPARRAGGASPFGDSSRALVSQPGFSTPQNAVESLSAGGAAAVTLSAPVALTVWQLWFLPYSTERTAASDRAVAPSPISQVSAAFPRG